MQLPQSTATELATNVRRDVAELSEELNALAASGHSVAVQNNMPGITTFTDDLTRRQFIWQGSGDPHGGDVREVASDTLNNPQFREQVLRGIFTLVNSQPEVLQRALALQRGHWDDRQLAASSASAEIEQSAAKVVAIGQFCIAPKGRDLCGSPALVMGTTAGEAPPLCKEHETLAPFYRSEKTGRLIEGQPEIVWKRI